MEPFLVAAGVGAAVAAFGVVAYYFSASLRFKRELKKIPPFPLRDAPENEPVRLCGVLRHIDSAPLRAPLSARPCAAWRVVVERYRQRGRSGHWEKVLDENDSRSFLIVEGDDVAEVDGTCLDMLLDYDDKDGTSFMGSIPPVLAHFCEERGIDTKTWLGFSVRLRYREGVLEEDEEVTVAGVGRWLKDPGRAGRGYRDVGRRFKLEALPDGRLLCTDHRIDG